ncbi:MAG: hypothetical protein ACI8ZW_001945 [Yoonia sp.]|jgi:hypothetical protein
MHGVTLSMKKALAEELGLSVLKVAGSSGRGGGPGSPSSA